MARRIAVVTHRRRGAAAESSAKIVHLLEEAGLKAETNPTRQSVAGCELILVLGGDGTILHAAELGRPAGVPILGINYGHVGFLSEADPVDAPQVVRQIAERSWGVDSRMTIDITIVGPDGKVKRDWALNEVAVEKDVDFRMLEVSIGVDGREISAFKVDTVLFSTATGSTAYNFSGGGPIVWPDVEGMVLTPVAAHALFTRPLVVGPNSQLELRVLDGAARGWCDGRRELRAAAGSTITAVKGEHPVLLARLNDTPFSGRLVTKFRLPVRGWRDPAQEDVCG